MQIKSIMKLKGKGLRITVDSTKFKAIPCQIGNTVVDQDIALKILQKIREKSL